MKSGLIQNLVKLVETEVKKKAEAKSGQDNVQDDVVRGPGQDPVAQRPEYVVFKEYDFTSDKLIKVKYFCGDCEVWITGGGTREMNHVDCEDEECDCGWNL